MKILLIEDDLAVGDALLAVLQDVGHTVVWVRMVASAVRALNDGGFHAVLLDLGLPDGDGMTLLRDVREAGIGLPVLILTSRDSVGDRVKGFDGGADDYLIKPFEIPELLARLRAVVRRATRPEEMAEPLWRLGDLLLDERRLMVTRAGVHVPLSRTEYALLCLLMRNSERVLTRTELESKVFPHNDGGALDVHMSNLRKKIGDGLIRTVRGVGYMVQGAVR